MNLWTCDIGPAPKPFRDSGAPFGDFRDDYDHLSRENSILSTPKGWVQSEHNRKLTEDGELVSYIIYSKRDDPNCERVITNRSEVDGLP